MNSAGRWKPYKYFPHSLCSAQNIAGMYKLLGKHFFNERMACVIENFPLNRRRFQHVSSQARTFSVENPWCCKEITILKMIFYFGYESIVLWQILSSCWH